MPYTHGQAVSYDGVNYAVEVVYGGGVYRIGNADAFVDAVSEAQLDSPIETATRKVTVLRITTSDVGRADIRDFEDLHCLVRAAASDGFDGSIEQLACYDHGGRNRLDGGPFKTVGELVRYLLTMPESLPLSAVGSDCGGYDSVDGSEVHAQVKDFPPCVHIEHFGD